MGVAGSDTSENMSRAATYGNNVGGASVHYWIATELRAIGLRCGLKVPRNQKGTGSRSDATHETLGTICMCMKPSRSSQPNESALGRRRAQAGLIQGPQFRSARLPCANGYCSSSGAAVTSNRTSLSPIHERSRCNARIYTDCEAIELSWNGRPQSRVWREFCIATGL